MSATSSSVLSSSFLSITPPPTTKSQAAAIRAYTGLPPALEKRVRDATSQLSGDRCILRNTRESTCYSYLLPRSTPDCTLTRLEYAWSLDFGQLNVDSSSNILRLSSDLHRSFQRCLWFLIPEDPTILKAYRRHKKRGPKDNDFLSLFPAGTYRYKLIPSRYLKFDTIEREPGRNADLNDEKGSQSQCYSYPFLDFPTIVSHVHPRFVIYHAGRSLLGRQYTFLHARPDILNAVEKIISIYKSWIRPIPPPEIGTFVRMSKSLTPNGGRHVENDRSDTSSVTRAERFNWRNEAWPDTEERQPEVLERGMLLVFNALLPRDKTKTETISKWLSDVSTSPNEFDVDPLSATPLS